MQKAFGIIGATMAATALIAASQPARASLIDNTYSVVVSEGVTGGAGIDSSTNPVFSGNNTASATFTYTGAINLANTAGATSGPISDLNSTFFTNSTTITSYVGSGSVAFHGVTIANYSSLASFLASSASSSPLQYASYYQFDLGIVQAGTVLTITHDDGASVFQGATRIGASATGVTSATTDMITVGTTGNTVLRYTRQNSTPSILQVSAQFPATPVPEPMSLGLLGAGLVGLGLIRRRNRAT